ncbi:DNA (cytosine-5-)-methyltransferase, partial [Streptomyces sp. SID11233]|nr:DNA (cytosine-5-)-methyltransferase [Streptomyces sp. SID11233]
MEICAGAGGQALGLHNAGFEHEALVEWDTNAVETLRTNSVKTFGWSPEKAERLRAMDVRDFRDEDEFKSLKKAADAGQCIDL